MGHQLPPAEDVVILTGEDLANCRVAIRRHVKTLVAHLGRDCEKRPDLTESKVERVFKYVDTLEQLGGDAAEFDEVTVGDTTWERR